MKCSITDVDKNLQATFAEDGVFDWYSVTETPELSLHGVFHNGTAFCRMPDEIAQTVSEGVTWLARHTAGGACTLSNHFPTDCRQACFASRRRLFSSAAGKTWSVDSL